MKRYRFFSSFEKEEQWLNDMARRGVVLIRKSGYSYDFQSEGTPGETVIRIDYRSFKTRGDFADYVAIFEDSGWQHLSGTWRSGFQYFKKAGARPEEDIFSDTDSRAGRYKRASQMWLTLAFSWVPALIALMSAGLVDMEALLNPKLLYYTNGLWELEGAAFWRAFLFETPFAVGRGILWAMFPVMILLYGIFAIMARRRYQRTIKDR